LAPIVLILALLLWCGLTATLFSLNSSDAAGNGLSQAFAILMIFALWGLLALALLLIGRQGTMPAWVGVYALFLLPLSCAASVASVELLRNQWFVAGRLTIAVPIVTAALMIAFCAWLYMPQLRAALPAKLATPATWGTVLVLSLLPWPMLTKLRREGKERYARVQEEFKAQEVREAESQREADLLKFKQLTPESPLREWLDFTTDGNELRSRALEGIRNLARRQADAEEMIGFGLDLPMIELANLNLTPTAKFCAIAGEFLRKDAESFRPRVPDPAPYSVMAFRVERHLPAMHWLVEHNCDIDVGVATYAEVVKLYPDEKERQGFLDKLAALRAKRGVAQ